MCCPLSLALRGGLLNKEGGSATLARTQLIIPSVGPVLFATLTMKTGLALITMVALYDGDAEIERYFRMIKRKMITKCKLEQTNTTST